jgi:mono/diheme cytochrome c family protein
MRLRLGVKSIFSKSIISIAFLLISLLLVACGGESLTNPTPKPDVVKAFQAEPATNNGNPSLGQVAFEKFPCLSCHTLNGSGGTAAVAPALDKIGTTAATRIEGANAAQYIRHMLVKPEDIQLPNYRNIMPSFINSATPQELENLVAYLLTLK